VFVSWLTSVKHVCERECVCACVRECLLVRVLVHCRGAKFVSYLCRLWSHWYVSFAVIGRGLVRVLFVFWFTRHKRLCV